MRGEEPALLPRLARVLAAFFAAADRWARVRFRAAEWPCRESAVFEAAPFPSLFSAAVVARERVRDGLRFGALAPFPRSRSAFLRVALETVPGFGGGSFTPALLALERPMAIACFAERAPCFPSRMCSISSLTNSPACVDGAFPCRFARNARCFVFFSGIYKGFATGTGHGRISKDPAQVHPSAVSAPIFAMRP